MNQIYVNALVGGLLIGSAAVLFLTLNGRIAGISGILWGALTHNGQRLWRWLFLVGLFVGAMLAHTVFGAGPSISTLIYGHLDTGLFLGTLLFLGAMVAGMWLASLVKPRPTGQGISNQASWSFHGEPGHISGGKIQGASDHIKELRLSTGNTVICLQYIYETGDNAAALLDG